ncbi:MAG: hypothetical protein K8R69_03865, partial [Deltaproteobacteria bacterium]|nr:hypothetical protein [Deltaproteobacteria bacterium]
LGGLRLAGWASGAAYQRLGSGSLREGVFSRLTQQGFQQGGTLTGILLGHALEQWTGLRRPQEGATTLIDSLATLLQFHVAGRLGSQAFGASTAAWEYRLESRTEALRDFAIGPARLFLAESLPLAPVLMAGAPEELLGPQRLFSLGSGEGGSSKPREPLPEIRPSLDGRTRPIDRQIALSVKVLEAQGVFWVIDIDTESRSRSVEVRVGDHLLPRGGSLRVRDGEVVSLGERRYVFREPSRDFEPEISSRISAQGVLVRRHLHPQYNEGRESRYELRLRGFLEGLREGEVRNIAQGPRGEVSFRLLRRHPLEVGERWDLEVFDEGSAFRVTLEQTPEAVIFDSSPIVDRKSPLLPIFADWVATHATIRAQSLGVRGISEDFHELLGFGMINSSYNHFEAQGDRMDLVTQPRSALLPMEFGTRHRAAAGRVFDAWALARLGQRVPTLLEIEAGAELPAFNHLGVEASMPAILNRLVHPRSRFLEIGFGDRLETLQAVERRGGLAWGLELDRVYPPEADREALRRSDIDVLFVNGSPFLFYAQHQVALPAAIDILRQFSRAEWLVIQAYNPRTPFEILRHAEELNRQRWEPMFFRAAESKDEAPIFPTDWCQRPDTPHALLIARRIPNSVK